MSLFKRILTSLLRILAGVPIVSLLAGGLLLLVLGTTLKGRSVGLSAVVLGGILFCSVGYWNRSWFKRIRRRFYAVLLPIGLLLYLVPMMIAPSGAAGDGCVRNCFLHGHGAFPRYSPWNVIERRHGRDPGGGQGAGAVQGTHLSLADHRRRAVFDQRVLGMEEGDILRRFKG